MKNKYIQLINALYERKNNENETKLKEKKLLKQKWKYM